jgi:hypothetical protein
MWSYFGLISGPWWHVLAAYVGTAIYAVVAGWVLYCTAIVKIPPVRQALERREIRRDQAERELRELARAAA